MSRPLVLGLPDNARYQELRLGNSLDPRTWTVVPRPSGLAESLSQKGACDAFVDDMVASLKTPAQLVFISVDQDEAGCHRFVSLAAASQSLLLRHGDQLTFHEEEEVKKLRDESAAVMLYATEANGDVKDATTASTKVQVVPAAVIVSPLSDFELCPHSSPWARNYSVIPDLSLGPTQRLILCDEATLTRSLPQERIFEHLRLIVNCHESRSAPGKYKVGSCAGKDPPKAIFQAVHEWHGLNSTEMNSANDSIQESMWEQLQHGSVAVHCLAGIHRAACIVACHFLWRHYVLGHRDIPCDPKVIYQRLKAVRPAVSPAYAHVLQKYEAHLKSKAK